MASPPDWSNNLAKWFLFMVIGTVAFPFGFLFGLIGEWTWYYDFMVGF